METCTSCDDDDDDGNTCKYQRIITGSSANDGMCACIRADCEMVSLLFMDYHDTC